MTEKLLVPDIGDFPHHHRPSDVVKLSERNPHAKILVTHNYSSARGHQEGFQMPALPEKIYQLEDFDVLQIFDDGSFHIINKKSKK